MTLVALSPSGDAFVLCGDPECSACETWDEDEVLTFADEDRALFAYAVLGLTPWQVTNVRYTEAQAEALRDLADQEDRK